MSPPEALSRYVLPDPPAGEDRRQAVRASLRVVHVAPARVTFTGYLALWRAPLSDADLSVFLTGKTDSGKSSYAALIQQHHGAEMDIKSLPASWTWTDNALELTAFHSKDAIMTVDEFVPQGSVNEMQQYYRKADRLLRSQANRQARGRLTSTLSQRPLKPPRGIIISTGEDIPRGHSLRARVLIGEMAKATMNWDVLTLCQRDAAAGIYAQAFAAYVQWVAGRYDAVRTQVKQEAEALRTELTAKHSQTRDLATRLLAGWKVFLDFACACEAITAAEQADLWNQAKAALQESLNTQDRFQFESDPARRFLDLLGAALAGGRAHLDGLDGGVPPEATTWGWEKKSSGDWQYATAAYTPKGELVGWIENTDIYLEPETSLAVAQHLARDQGETLPVSRHTLQLRLKEDGLLSSWDKARQRMTIRRTLGGAVRTVLHISQNSLTGGPLSSEEPSKTSKAPFEEGTASVDREKADEKPSSEKQNRPFGEEHRPEETQAKSNEYTQNGRFGRFSTGGETTQENGKKDTPNGGESGGRFGRSSQIENRPNEHENRPESPDRQDHQGVDGQTADREEGEL